METILTLTKNSFTYITFENGKEKSRIKGKYKKGSRMDVMYKEGSNKK